MKSGKGAAFGTKHQDHRSRIDCIESATLDGVSTAVFDIDYCRNDGVGGAFDQDALRLVMESQWGHC